MKKKIIANKDDNFGVVLHFGAEQPYFKEDENTDNFFKGKSLVQVVGGDVEPKKYERQIEIGTEFYTDFKRKIENGSDFYTDMSSRQLIHSQTLCEGLPMRSELSSFSYSTNWRLAIGMGGASIFDTSICLHHIYGFPYLPASGIKGMLRSWIITEYFGEINGELDLVGAEERALKTSEYFCKIFGCPDSSALKNRKGEAVTFKGEIVFFDAYPTNTPTVSVDIINPHYPEYYNKEGKDKKPPADWQSPKPINFLTVKKTSFQFLIGLKKGKEDFDVEFGKHKGNVIQVLHSILKEALTTHGIGAKTAVGYGYMKESR